MTPQERDKIATQMYQDSIELEDKAYNARLAQIRYSSMAHNAGQESDRYAAEAADLRRKSYLMRAGG